jgi:hypothetical protein
MRQGDHSTRLSAFFDELSKVAVSVQEISEPGLLTTHGLAGKWVPHAKVIEENPALAKKVGLRTGRDALFMAPREEFLRAYGPQGGEAYKAVKRHELTHYLRGKRGKMERVGTPGLRGLGATAREELIAHFEAMRGRSPGVQKALAQSFVPGVVGSVRHAYQNRPLRQVAMGGTLGRVARALRLMR